MGDNIRRKKLKLKHIWNENDVIIRYSLFQGKDTKDGDLSTQYMTIKMVQLHLLINITLFVNYK